MTSTHAIRTITGAAIAAGAMLFAFQTTTAAHADTATVRETAATMKSANNLKQLGLAVHNYDADGDVDGRDFLVWQRNPAAPVGAGDLADWQSNYGSTGAAAQGTHEVGHLLGLGSTH